MSTLTLEEQALVSQSNIASVLAGQTQSSTLPPFLQRMLIEQIELNTRYIALSNFLAKNTQPEEMSDIAWELLHSQLAAMENYRDILIERITLALRETTTNTKGN